MAQKQNRTRLDAVPVYSYGLKQFVRFAYECIPIFPIDRCGVILIEKDTRFRDMLGQVVAEPEAPLGTGRFAPCIPGVVAIVLASRIQTVDGDDTRYC